MPSAIASASSRSVVAAPCGCAIESERISASNARRSSARSMLAMLLPRMVKPARSSGSARLIAVWPPNCTTTPRRLLLLDDRADRFLVERLEVQARAAVEIGAHRLRVAVDHHRIDALPAKCHRGVDAAVIELDALTDADRSAAEHHDGVRRRRRCRGSFVLGLVGRVVVGRRRLELGGAGVDAFEDRAHAGALRGAREPSPWQYR